MFLPDEIVMYGADLCKIEAVKEQSFFPGQQPRPYYILHPLSNRESTVYVPCNQGEAKLRAVMTAGEITALRKRVGDKMLKWIENRQLRSRAYTEILQSGDPEQLIPLIRCLLHKKAELIAQHKKLSVSDEKILTAAEKVIDEEFSFALDIEKENLPEFFEE